MGGSIIMLAVRLEIAIKHEGDRWIAWCRLLDVVSQGNSKKGAVAALTEAVELWFESCIQRGVLDDALREAGFIVGKPGGKPPDGASIVHLPTRHVKRTSDFAPSYIDVKVPAYIAAHQLQTTRATL